MEVMIKLSAKEAADAIVSGVLPQLLSAEAKDEVAIASTQVQQPAPVTTTPEQTAPVQQPQTNTVPTTTKTYTMDELAVAGTALMDQGRMAELQALVQSFGVSTLTELPQAQFGAFALKLREMGAPI